MCILCVVSRWSRRVVTMLPWLVIPFIITWAFSQLLPPGYRLEVTSTRLACLGVLLSSLGWYELLMPWLSSWRARRSAILRERRLIEAQEAAKWRKEATRRCRNCLTAYKVQTPGCGKFMCTYCGHVSKRPVLEMPPSLSHSGRQVLHRVPHSGGQLANGALFRGSIVRHDTGCWSRSSEKKSCWFGEGACRNENCKAWQLFLKILQCAGNLFLFAGIIWRKVIGASRATSESCRGSPKNKDDSAGSHESRSEKARKRANEKRQARLERELLEVEEKKQREEVAWLVEERRRQREEKLQVEKESEREAAAEREREIRRVRELERRRKDKVKERAGDQSGVKVEEEVHVSSIPIKCGEQFTTCKSNKPADSFKTAKVSVGIQRDQGGSRIKVVPENPTRSDFPKYGANFKQRLVPASKVGSFFQKHGSCNDAKVDTRSLNSKVCKVEAITSSSSTGVSLKSEGDESSSSSAWRKAPWFNAWAKGSEALRRHCTLSHESFTSKHGDKLDLNLKDGGNPFNNKAVGAKQSSSVSTVVTQPPIAPPSTQTGSLHQLFSSPTIFPPLDFAPKLASQSQQVLQGDIKSSFSAQHTFFQAPVCVGFQMCTGGSVPSSPGTPAPVRDSHFSPQQLTESADKGGLHCTDVSQHSTLLGSTILPETIKSMDIQCSPVSPNTVCVSDMQMFDLNTDISPKSFALKSIVPNLFLEMHDDASCELSSVCLEKMDGISVTGQERMWDTLTSGNRIVQKQFEPTKDKDLDAVQLPHLSTVQSLFDSEILLPDSLSLSPQKEESMLRNGESMAYVGQAFDRKRLWSLSAYSAAVQIWDDADNNQKLPPEFVDCITQEIMRDPVITADGHSYERSAIEKWLKHHDTSPKTGEVLPPPPGGVGVDKTLRPNHILRGQIIEYNEKLAKMQRNAVSWSGTSIDGEYLGTSTSGVLSF